jgi:hypothetical protein
MIWSFLPTFDPKIIIARRRAQAPNAVDSLCLKNLAKFYQPKQNGLYRFVSLNKELSKILSEQDVTEPKRSN